MRVLAIDVQRGNPFPQPVGVETDPIVVRFLIAGAVAAIADAGDVTHIRSRAINTDERAVHLGVAVCLSRSRPVANLRQFHTVRLLHDQFVERKRARVSRIVHLVKQVGGLAQ